VQLVKKKKVSEREVVATEDKKVRSKGGTGVSLILFCWLSLAPRSTSSAMICTSPLAAALWRGE
jgi:hypothetical protein